MKFKDALEQALESIEEYPSLATQMETRREVDSATNWLKKFLKKAQVAKFKTDAVFIRLVFILGTKNPKEIREAATAAGFRAPGGKSATPEKVALKAMEEGAAVKFEKELSKDPEEKLKDEFFALAALPEEEVEAEVKKCLTKAKAKQYADAVGFDVEHKVAKSGKNKGKKMYDSKATLVNAMEVLKPYIDSMRDAR